jgi:hypothetical protein
VSIPEAVRNARALMQAGALPFKEAPGWVTFRRPS